MRRGPGSRALTGAAAVPAAARLKEERRAKRRNRWGNAAEGDGAKKKRSRWELADPGITEPVSYTHLTLPTICSV